MLIANRLSVYISKNKLLLSLLWLLGLLLGAVFAGTGNTLSSLMRTAASARVSIVSLLLRCLLPFLISLLAIHLTKRWLVFAVCFIKAFLFGLCVSSVTFCFYQASWIIILFLLFSDIALMPALFYFWIKNIDSCDVNLRSSILFFAIAIVVACVDYCYIAPYLVMLIKS